MAVAWEGFLLQNWLIITEMLLEKQVNEILEKIK
jgi:hypothetical protein